MCAVWRARGDWTAGEAKGPGKPDETIAKTMRNLSEEHAACARPAGWLVAGIHVAKPASNAYSRNRR